MHFDDYKEGVTRSDGCWSGGGNFHMPMNEYCTVNNNHVPKLTCSSSIHSRTREGRFDHPVKREKGQDKHDLFL